MADYRQFKLPTFPMEIICSAAASRLCTYEHVSVYVGIRKQSPSCQSRVSHSLHLQARWLVMNRIAACEAPFPLACVERPSVSPQFLIFYFIHIARVQVFHPRHWFTGYGVLLWEPSRQDRVFYMWSTGCIRQHHNYFDILNILLVPCRQWGYVLKLEWKEDTQIQWIRLRLFLMCIPVSAKAGHGYLFLQQWREVDSHMNVDCPLVGHIS